MTRQRQVILDEVTSGCHLSADEIYEKVRRRLPQISMGTVYRNLDTLVSLGRIVRLQPEHPPMRFDGNTQDHYHVRCVHCGKVEDMKMDPLEEVLQNLEKSLDNLTQHGILGHRLDFMGLCRQCTREGRELSGLKQRT